MEKENIHIGKLVRQKLKEQERSVAWLAKKMHYNHSNLCKNLKQEHLYPTLLLQISAILEYDFFMHYSVFLKNQNNGTSLLSE